MPEREWKPGDVALVEAGCWANRRVAVRGVEGWLHASGFSLDSDGILSVVRPLVVIDPEDREQVLRLADAIDNSADDLRYDGTGPTRTELAQAALRSLIAPPKPSRPGGWGALVEDVTGAYWTLYAPESDAWINYREGNRHWDEIDAVRVLSEGVVADA